MMTRRLMTMLMPAMIACLTACDNGGSRDMRTERESRLYQSAMNDYSAGRLDAAVKGFAKVVETEPANASARFQLGSLLQDHAKDYEGAYCAFREYLIQRPASEKMRMAKDRLALCEKELARKLATKYGLADTDALAKENAAARAELAESQKTVAKLRDDLMQAMQRIAALNQEVDRYKVALRADDEKSVSTVKDEVKTAKALLDDADENDRVTQSDDIARLRIEEAGERALGSSLLAPQPADAKAKRDEAAAAERAKKASESARPKEPLHEQRPATYTVQDGDTLYKIALRFYGRVAAWKMIRNANKAKISMDGRVKVGDTLRLP